jgi:hypothetical protein
MIPALLVGITESGVGWPGILRLGVTTWVVAHGVPVVIAGVSVSLLPWGAVAVPILALAVAGRWAARTAAPVSVRGAWVLVGSAVVAYATVTAAAAAWAGLAVVPALARAVVVAAAVLAAVVWGPRLRGSVPMWAATPLRAGGVAVAALIGMGAVLGAIGLVMRFDDAVAMLQALAPGIAGGIVVALLAVAYVPVLAVWGTSYLLGAGVVIGPEVIISPLLQVATPTQLPPFPLLAALPPSATPFAWALPVLGVLAGVLAGLVITRSAREEPRLVRAILAVGAAGVSGLGMLALATLASGSLGEDRLSGLGPPASMVAMLAFVLVLAGAVPTSVIPPSAGKPRLAVAEHGAAAASESGADRDEGTADV